MKPLVLFGNGEIAQLVKLSFDNDSDRTVVACTVDRAYVDDSSVFGVPLVAFEEVVDRYPPGTHDLFVAVGYGGMNALRREKCDAARALGYDLVSYVSSRCANFAASIGWNCFILEHNTLQPFVTIGNNVTVFGASIIAHHSTIEDDVFISSNVAVAGHVTIGRASFVGLSATIRDGVTIGERNVLGAGTVILADTDDEAVYRAPESELLPIPSSELKRI